MVKTKIERADVVWNPVRGCSRVSEGCVNCYAERMAARFSGPGQPYEGLAMMTPSGPRWSGNVRLIEEQLEKPLHWSKPRRIFVNSMSDLFHEGLSFEDISRVFSVMKLAMSHQYLILTKRPDRMRQFIHRLVDCVHWKDGLTVFHQCFSHVWLGVSVEDQRAAEERIPILLYTPAAVRFVSAEPLLGPVDLSNIDGRYHDALKGQRWEEGRLCSTPKLDWVICGGESGPGARPMHPVWARSIRDDCEHAGVPFYFKQWGEWDQSWLRVGKKRAGCLLDGREWKEFPAVDKQKGAVE